MRKKNFLSLIITLQLALGIIAFYLESEFELPNGIRLGASLLGVSSIIWGLEELLNHRSLYSFSWQKGEKQQTLMTIGSIATSLLRFLIGIGLLIISLLGFIGIGSQAVDFFKTRPGIGIVFAGALGFTYSIQQFFMQKSASESLKLRLEKFFQRLFSAILALLSLLLLAVGTIEILHPELFNQILNALVAALGLPFLLE